MAIVRYRHEQLAEHLKGQLARAELVEPLPGMRAWASKLGVSVRTLTAAVHSLAGQRLLRIDARRGVKLLRRPAAPADAQPSTRIARLLYKASDYPATAWAAHWWGLLAHRLRGHGIQLVVEACRDERLAALGRRPAATDPSRAELLLLRSLPAEHQRRLARSGRPAFVLGYPAPGIDLPYVAADLEGAIARAVARLLEPRPRPLYLLVSRRNIYTIQRQCRAFEAAVSGQPNAARGRVIRVPLEPAAQLEALRRLARRVDRPCGLIVVAPVAVSAVMTCLLGRGVKVPQQAELALVDTIGTLPLVWPLPHHYALSTAALLRVVTRAADAYFRTGKLPAIRRTLPVTLVSPGADAAAHAMG